ncbi:hypothetical protein NKR19_g10361, partial [Coniochaeta hoffmannii]
MSGIGNEPAVSDVPWGTTEMKAALVEGTSEPANEPQAEATEDGKKKAAPNGWVESKGYRYDEFTRDAQHDWDSNAKIYEWDGETGDVGPEHPKLEIDLFGAPDTRISHGQDFS